jgi:hypothetical protein
VKVRAVVKFEVACGMLVYAFARPDALWLDAQGPWCALTAQELAQLAAGMRNPTGVLVVDVRGSWCEGPAGEATSEAVHALMAWPQVPTIIIGSHMVPHVEDMLGRKAPIVVTDSESEAQEWVDRARKGAPIRC